MHVILTGCKSGSQPTTCQTNVNIPCRCRARIMQGQRDHRSIRVLQAVHADTARNTASHNQRKTCRECKVQSQAAQSVDNASCPTISMAISTAVRTLSAKTLRGAIAQRGRPSREKELLRCCRRHFMQPYRVLIAMARLRVSRSRGLGYCLRNETILPDESARCCFSTRGAR